MDSNPLPGSVCTPTRLASTMQILQTRSTICDSTDALHRTSPPHTNPKRDYRFNLHKGRRKNSLQQWVGVTINTLMISRVQREKASGLRRRQKAHPSKMFSREIRHYDIWTRNTTMPQSHRSTIIMESTALVWLWYKRCFFRNTTRRVEPGNDDRRSRRPGKNWTGFAGWEAGGVRGKTVGCVWIRFYENISWVMHVISGVRRPRPASGLWLKCIGTT